MKNLNGNLNQRNISKIFLTNNVSTLLETLALFGLGALAIILHVKLRIPYKLPGHHGVEFMALIMIGRFASKLPTASTISSLGVGLMLLFPIWAGKDPFAGIVYMLPGFALDFLYYKFKNYKSILIFALIGGLSYGLIPVARIFIMTITGFPYSSLLASLIYPLFTFTLFGSIGSLFGASLVKQVKKRNKAKPN